MAYKTIALIIFIYSLVTITFIYHGIFKSNQAYVNGIWEQEIRATGCSAGNGAWRELDILKEHDYCPWDTWHLFMALSSDPSLVISFPIGPSFSHLFPLFKCNFLSFFKHISQKKFNKAISLPVEKDSVKPCKDDYNIAEVKKYLDLNSISAT